MRAIEARLCEPPLERLADGELRTCLLLDQDVFTTLWGRGGPGVLARFGLPTVLMVNQRTPRIMDHAIAAGVTTVVEKPLLGGILFDAIRSALDGTRRLDGNYHAATSTRATSDASCCLTRRWTISPRSRSRFRRGSRPRSSTATAKKLEAFIARHGKVRVLEIIHDFEGMDAKALWHDLKFSLRHLNDFSRCAIVSDAKFLSLWSAIAEPFIDCEVAYFPPDEVDAARDWLLWPEGAADVI